MHILLLEDRPGTATQVEGDLAAAGHRVSRCHDAGDDGASCRGIEEGHRCPLDEGTVDVAAVVRAQESDLPTPTEDGARCALRRHVPVVLVGAHTRSPYLRYAADTVAELDEAVPTLEAAATAPLRGLTDTATAAFADVLTIHGLDAGGARAEVRRVDGGLRVRLQPGSGSAVSEKVAEVAAVRVAGAVRAVDPDSRTVDVTLAA